MTSSDLFILLPFIVLAADAVIVTLLIGLWRNHFVTVVVTLVGLVTAFVSLFLIAPGLPRQITPLVIIDGYALFFVGLIIASGFVTVLLSYGYLAERDLNREEYYLLLILALIGSSVLVASSHFASFFIGLEILGISLYALIAYSREGFVGVEAGIKYLILAAVSSAFLLFGMALIYSQSGSLVFVGIAAAAVQGNKVALSAGMALLVVGIGFKLAVVPFHMWTPDVYEGAPAPVTGLIATVSKGAIFALLLRYFTDVDLHAYRSLILVFVAISIASMFVGNLLALLQNNVKRILAYSSIAHLGYLLVAFLASGETAVIAVSYYLTAYFVTTLGAFGVITVLSGKERDADKIDDYRGLAARRPWLAAVFTVMLLSLAGIPLTAGFIGKFYVMAAGIGSALWLMVVALVVTSVIGLFYYLRVIIAMYGPVLMVPNAVAAPANRSVTAGIVLAALTFLLIWFGAYPSSLLQIIEMTVSRLT